LVLCHSTELKYFGENHIIDMQDYKSSLIGASGSRKFKAFSYLPQLSKESVQAKIMYIVDKG